MLVLATYGGDSTQALDVVNVPPGGRVLAAVFAENGQVAELDARTLRTLRSADIGFPPHVAAKSPDGSLLAVGSGNGATVRLVERGSMRAGAVMTLPGQSGLVDAIAWPAERRLIALVSQRQPRVVVVDPEDGRAIGVHELDASPLAWQTTARGLVLLVAPGAGIGPAQLVVVDAAGHRAITLDGVRAGWPAGDTPEKLIPGLAADPSGRRAVVVPPGDRVAEIDLATLTVRHHQLRRPVSLLGRLRNWLEPRAHAKSIDGPQRTAVWVGGDHVAVAGMDISGRDGRATGAQLIDTRDWTVRPLTGEASAVAAGAGAVLAFGGGWTARGVDGVGLRGFDATGRQRFSFFGRRYLSSVAVAGRYAYVEEGNRAMRFRVIDLHTGRVLRVARTRTTTVVLGRA